VLAPNGCLILVDVKAHTNVADNRSWPLASILYTISLMHCMPISLVRVNFQYFLIISLVINKYFKNLKNEPDGLGLGTCWGREKAVELLRACGFTVFHIDDSDSVNIVYSCRKSN